MTDNTTREVYIVSLDVFAKIVTTMVFAMMPGGIILMFTTQPWYGGLFLFFTGFFLTGIFYLYSVKCYILTNDKLIIQRPFSRFNREILYSDIISARLPEKGDFKWTLRTAGNGGMFGYSGDYSSEKLGDFTMYSTNRKKSVIIWLRHPKETIVISPDDPKMAEAISSRLVK
ncbi:MAG TPA: PH domain-containing protein [Bacteroidia bacterium]|jgi:hypothetical protein|nr:PH domain-containing protein [Bacteroidia bacterium]